MTPKQALQLLESFTQNITANRQTHIQIIQALNVLHLIVDRIPEVIEKKTEPPVVKKKERVHSATV